MNSSLAVTDHLFYVDVVLDLVMIGRPVVPILDIVHLGAVSGGLRGGRQRALGEGIMVWNFVRFMHAV